jgi:hypothetical protein
MVEHADSSLELANTLGDHAYDSRELKRGLLDIVTRIGGGGVDKASRSHDHEVDRRRVGNRDADSGDRRGASRCGIGRDSECGFKRSGGAGGVDNASIRDEYIMPLSGASGGASGGNMGCSDGSKHGASWGLKSPQFFAGV